MKLKAVVHRGTKDGFIPDCPEELVKALNDLHTCVSERVLLKHLHAVGFGPAEFYVQECDFAAVGVSKFGFCEVRLTGVSVNDNRAPNDFVRARNELEAIYAELIKRYLPRGQKMQLFVSIMLDASIRFGSNPSSTSIVEGEAKWIDGEKEPVEAL
jgi:hypothetical protein